MGDRLGTPRAVDIFIIVLFIYIIYSLTYLLLLFFMSSNDSFYQRLQYAKVVGVVTHSTHELVCNLWPPPPLRLDGSVLYFSTH